MSEWKKFAILSVCLMTASGCGRSGRVEYVHDSNHHCKVISHRGGEPYWDYEEDRAGARGGATYYSCDNGIAFHIDDNEKQP